MKTNIISGIIADASAIKAFQKTDGTESKSAILYIQEKCNDVHPKEVAVKVTGNNVSFAGCVGCEVECEYIVRVFPFKDRKTGGRTFGNDVYAVGIKVINADRSAMLNIKNGEDC